MRPCTLSPSHTAPRNEMARTDTEWSSAPVVKKLSHLLSKKSPGDVTHAFSGSLEHANHQNTPVSTVFGPECRRGPPNPNSKKVHETKCLLHGSSVHVTSERCNEDHSPANWAKNCSTRKPPGMLLRPMQKVTQKNPTQVIMTYVCSGGIFAAADTHTHTLRWFW